MIISVYHFRWSGLLKFNFRFELISPKVAEFNFRGESPEELLENDLNKDLVYAHKRVTGCREPPRKVTVNQHLVKG